MTVSEPVLDVSDKSAAKDPPANDEYRIEIPVVANILRFKAQ